MDERSPDGRLEGAIAETRAVFVGALNNGDAKAAAHVYAEEARLVAPSGEPITGRESIEAFWRAGLEAGMCDVELEALELERRGRVAYEIGRYSLRLEPAEGGTVIDRGKYVLVHERQKDGSWQWAVEMFNPDAPPARAGERGKE
jgi:ketosteroid isomerase-like protein